MGTAFSTALSALNADSTAIDVVGNNLANLNTTGFKASTAEFSDLMAEQLGTGTGNGQVGMGVGQLDSVQDFSQGSVTTTGGALDAAIQGNGFFVVTDPTNNAQLYTRDGSFQLNSTGDLVTATGQSVQGWTAINGVVNTNGAAGDITVPVGATIAPQATANMSMNVNLDASTAVNGTYSAPIQVYDSLGAAHTLTVDFTETGPGAWSYSVNIPNADVTNSVAGTTSTSLVTGTLGFDANGNLISPANTLPTTPNAPVVVTTGATLADGANLSVNWNLFNSAGTPEITQYAQASSMSNPIQDGFAAGQISQINIQNGGLVVASYTNGQQSTLAQLAVASISNPTSLVQVGDNNLQATAATAQAAIGVSGAGGNGTVQGGSLEASNTDMAAEFTQLLTYERSYQAASRVITTSDQLTQETVNLIH
jgi:flagellar hook protein FlgE